jgi:hypothetical protein
MEVKIKKVTISVTTDNDVTMQRSVPVDGLGLISIGTTLKDTYYQILSGLKERFRDE